MPARLRPTAPVAADAILVGDPGRALLLAQSLLEQPKMSNHARGLWGYSGRTPAGRELTIQSTGMGGPSAAIVLADLAKLGVRQAIRIGTCTAIRGEWKLGELVVVSAARSADGKTQRPDQALTTRLEGVSGAKGRRAEVVSLDHLYRPGDEEPAGSGELADMQTAALFSRAADLEVAAAAALIVAETGEGTLNDEELEERAKAVGAAAAEVFST